MGQTTSGELAQFAKLMVRKYGDRNPVDPKGTKMFHNTYICFKDMQSARANCPVRCPICGKEMIRLHYKISIPKKKRKLWNKFADWLGSYWVYYKEYVEKY